MRGLRVSSIVVGLALMLGACHPGPSSVDGRRIAEANQHPGDWVSYGRTYDEQRFSPLTQIDDGNVGRLGLAWFADLDTNRGQEATPLEIGGVIYTTTAWSKVEAYDATTGRQIWSYDPKVPGDWGVKACCDVVNRGLAMWKGKLYVGALDGRLIALDAKTGRPVWITRTFGQDTSYASTGAPRVVKGRVIIGTGGAEYNQRGFVSAYDAETGRLDWRFYTVPGDPSKPDRQPSDQPLRDIAAKTWAPGTWKVGGGGTVWDTIVYDPKLDLLYFGTDNGDPWNQRYRGVRGDNLFLTSIIAVRPETGKYVWHYQLNPGDEWDYSAVQPIILADLKIGGRTRQVLMQAPKNGFFYVLDRKTGELLSAKNYVTVNWAKGIDLKTGRPIETPEARYSDTGKPWVGVPGPLGGHSWNPMAYSPKTGLVYLPANEAGFPYQEDPAFKHEPLGENLGLDLSGGGKDPDYAAQKAQLASLKGYLLAWDPVAQKAVWRADHPGPANGGVVVTAGNVVFEGSYDGKFAAWRADTGKPLWSFDAQAPIMAAPMTYQVGAVQYVAVMTCGGGAFGLSAGLPGLKSGHPHQLCRLLAFDLGGQAKLPPLPAASRPPLNPPPATATAEVVHQGAELYGRYCGICHGGSAVSAGVTPDLRYTPLLASDGFFDVVLGGALRSQGMVSFSRVLTHDQAAAVRAYLIQRANDTKAAQAKGEDLSAG
jgi:PQQ-dependent dehydrogenase (methanol/ethanol family)